MQRTRNPLEAGWRAAPGRRPRYDGVMQRLLLIDGHSNLYRAFYAIRGLSTRDGMPTGAAFGFLRMLHKLLEDLEPTHLGVAFDVGRETFRTRLDERYKAQRKPMPEELEAQIPLVREALELMGIPILELPDFEADDVIGTLARKAAEEKVETVLATSDKDMFQLVEDPLVKLWHTRHERLLDEAGAEELFGVPPRQVPEVLALMGDSSDNVPGCPGIGEKGAKQLVGRWDTVAELYAHLDEVEPTRARNALAEHREEVELSHELVVIRTDLELPLDLASLRRSEPDAQGLATLYRRLEFGSLLKELDLTDESSRALAVKTTTPAQLARMVGGLALGEGWAAVATGQRVGVCRDVPEALAELAPVLGHEWVVHSSKELLRALRDRGLDWEEPPRDVALAAYLLDPGEDVTLEVVARHHLGALPPTPVASDLGDAAAAEQALWCHLAGEAVFAELENEDLGAVYQRFEEPLVPVLEAMERRGIRLDRELLGDLARRLESSMGELEREIHHEAGGAFNVNSPQQLAEILFERLGYPVLKRTGKTRRPSTAVEVLEELSGRGYRLPALILEYREQAKLKGTYVDALPRQVEDDGRIHTRFHQTVAATGRLSSSDPNLQNIPVRTEMGREIRRAFVADQGFLLLAADYSQIELRILAHMSGDSGLLAAFRAGEDIHRATAAAVLGKAPGEVIAAERRAAKTVNFGLMYGMGAFSLGRDLHLSTAEAQAFIDTYFARFAGVKAYMDSVRERARRDGRVSTLFGRFRRIANLDHSSAPVRAAAERMATNAPIQGTAADVIKLAMIEVERMLEGEDARLLLQVHDELVLEVPEADIEAVAAKVKKVMEGVVDLEVPLLVEVNWGPSWYDAK